ncbi:MAG: ATP-dependent RecD-like DNA helicase [Clostridia bacterium]|nr:ATP-dependent RecD-like DNA helicase [Clostridia bacterium]
MDEQKDLITLEGTIEYVTYQNEQNGYAVCELLSGEDSYTIVGIMPYIAAGEEIKAMGKFETHQSYGRQFRVEYYEKQMPKSREAMYKYLASGAIPGIGKITAKKIVDLFGEDTFDVMEHNPEYLTDIPGITPKKARKIHESFAEQFGMRSVMVFCRDYFGPAIAVKIYKRWGSGAVDLLKKNPYLLCDEISGVGFEKADQMAQSLGCEGDSPFRIRAGIKYALSHNATHNGHVFIPKDKLIGLSAQLLDLPVERVEEVVEAGITGLRTIRYGSTECVYLEEYYQAEKYIASKLVLLDEVCQAVSEGNLDRMITQIEYDEGMTYARMQRQAIRAAFTGGVMVLTGGPGTGKTTIVKGIIRMADRMGLKVALAAPTGRAAKRMSEATQQEAKTVHRMLEMKFSADGKAQFLRNENDLLEGDIFIVDEASMLDTLLLEALLKAIKPGARLILIGDADQLPSVGAGHVLCDVIASDRFTTVRLTEIFRQAQESRIVTNAHAINHGELPILDDKDGDFFFLTREDENLIAKTIVDLCLYRLPRTYGQDIREDLQVITPSRKGRAGTEVLNALLQEAQNPPSDLKKEKRFRDVIFREGDKVMQIKNNYDILWTRGEEEGSGIFNGDIGRIEQINFADETMVLRFDDRIAEYDFSQMEELEHAWAITSHKSQGSEYPVVTIPAYNYSSRLLTRNLLYTAVTRAQRMVIMVGRPQVVQGMVENNRQVNRYTGLRFLLSQYSR